MVTLFLNYIFKYRFSSEVMKTTTALARENTLVTTSKIRRNYVDGLKREVIFSLHRLDDGARGSTSFYNYNSEFEILVPIP